MAIDDLLHELGLEEGPNEKAIIEAYRQADNPHYQHTTEDVERLAEEVRICEEQNSVEQLPKLDGDWRKESDFEKQFFDAHPGQTRLGKSKLKEAMQPTREEDAWWAGEAAEAGEDAVSEARRQGRPSSEIDGIRSKYAELGDPDRRMRMAAEKAKTAALEKQYEQLIEAIPYARALAEQQERLPPPPPAPVGPPPVATYVSQVGAQQEADRVLLDHIGASDRFARANLPNYDRALQYIDNLAHNSLIAKGVTDPLKRNDIIRNETLAACRGAVIRGEAPAVFMVKTALAAGWRGF